MTYGVDYGYRGCCGVYELHTFADNGAETDNYTDDSDIIAGNFSELLENIRNEFPTGKVLHIWFHKLKKADGTFEPEYVWDELRQLVRAIPNVVHIAETRNPNSGNMIDGYSWINTK